MSVVVPFGRWPTRGPVVDVATILDDPTKPSGGPLPAPVLRCRRCRRRCATLVRGLGSGCARRWAGRVPRVRRPRGVEHVGPDLLDLLGYELKETA